MRMLKSRHVIAALAIGGFAMSSALLGSGTAAADMIDDIDPLLTSTCSFAQIDAALHVVAPDAAARLDASPAQKAVLEMAFSQPTEQRVAMFEQLSSQRERMGSLFGNEADSDDMEPKAGDTETESGTKTPESGATKPGSDEKKPESDEKKPESGAKKPESDEKKPESGGPKLDTGSAKPEAGTTKADLGTTMRRVADTCHKY